MASSRRWTARTTPPSADAVSGFEQARKSLDVALASWEILKTKDLAALNAALKKAGQPGVEIRP